LKNTAIALLSHTVPAKAEEGITSCDKLFYSLLIPVPAPGYQPSRHNSSFLVIFSKFVSARIFLQPWKHDNFWRQTTAVSGITHGCWVSKIYAR